MGVLDPESFWFPIFVIPITVAGFILSVAEAIWEILKGGASP